MKVVAAAIKLSPDYPLIFTAKRHVNIYEMLRDWNIHYDKNECVEGFLTDTDQFVDRIEAKKIAVAANQLIVPLEETYPALYSEDVW